MRRSAAPSQKQKRGSFSPPFMTPPMKKPCLLESPASDKAGLGVTPTCHVLNENKSNLVKIVEEAATNTRYYAVLWCKLSGKKHKKWEGDAVISVKGRTVVLKDLEGKELSRNSGYKIKDLEELVEGSTLPIGGKEIEIQQSISAEDFLRGKCFHQSVQEQSMVPTVAMRQKPKPFRLPTKYNKENVPHPGKPLYDVSHPSSVLLPRPPPEHQVKNSTGATVINDVLVDPFLGSKLRPHQKVGVTFMYTSVMGFRNSGYTGAILADEMGLGKTLQCITLAWTLLKQGPYNGKPTCGRILIITPSSLTNNWRKEFEKWLGKERIEVFVVDQQNKIETYRQRRLCPVLIISYEMAVRSVDVIKSLNFDLMLCDEGHRLKNTNIKTTNQLSSLPIRRRVLLSGTPIQNDMQELFALAEFVNPGILGTSHMFKRVFEDSIVRSKQPQASEEDKQIGEARAEELNRLISGFTIRRTQEIINRYLPPKYEYVVFCQPMQSQSQIYSNFIESKMVQKCFFSGEYADHLSAICTLRKLCNHPGLVQKEDLNLLTTDQNTVIDDNFSEEDSGKLAVTSCMLYFLHQMGHEKIVLVSNFTTTLDMLQTLCEKYQYSYLRLDGSTPTNKRQTLVDRFNNKYNTDFVFLLSAKAGGMGLNLIGSSRIILFDIDWNPATDLQSMARVWRDGQKNQVYIYRLLLTGSLEEKMYQRQISKQGLSGSVVDARADTNVQFSTEELKDLFKFDSDTKCSTHDLLNCSCGVDQIAPHREEVAKGNKSNTLRATMDQLFSWQHHSTPFDDGRLEDPCLEAAGDFISFVMKTNSDSETTSIISQE